MFLRLHKLGTTNELSKSVCWNIMNYSSHCDKWDYSSVSTKY